MRKFEGLCENLCESLEVCAKIVRKFEGLCESCAKVWKFVRKLCESWTDWRMKFNLLIENLRVLSINHVFITILCVCCCFRAKKTHLANFLSQTLRRRQLHPKVFYLGEATLIHHGHIHNTVDLHAHNLWTNTTAPKTLSYARARTMKPRALNNFERRGDHGHNTRLTKVMQRSY